MAKKLCILKSFKLTESCLYSMIHIYAHISITYDKIHLTLPQMSELPQQMSIYTDHFYLPDIQRGISVLQIGAMTVRMSYHVACHPCQQ